MVLSPAAALLCALLAGAGFAGTALAQGAFAPIHRYSFSNPAGAAPDGSVVTDSAGGADGLVRGAGANFTGSKVTLPGGSSATQAYVDLPNGLLSVNSTNNGGNGAISIEGWVKVTGNFSWGRIFDFGSSITGEVTGPGGGGEGRDYLMLSGENGTDVTMRRTELRNEDPGGGGIVTVDHVTSDFNKVSHFVVTWDEQTGLIRTYEDGALVSSVTTDDAMSDINDVNCWLGRSNWTGDANLAGEFDEFRIYDQVMPPEQVRASFIGGPDTIAAGPVQIVVNPTNVTQIETRPVAFFTFAVGDLPITYQWYKNDVAVPGQTSAVYSNASVSVLDDNAQFYAVAANDVGGNAYTATSQVAILHVVGDTTPPTVLQVRVNRGNELEIIFSEAILAQDAVNLANFMLTGPAGVPSITSAAVGSDASRVILTLDGPLPDCDFYNVAISGVHDVSPSENAIADGTSRSFWNYVPLDLIHRYTFNNPAGDASGSIVPDSFGTADGIVQNGAGVTRFTGSRVTLSGGASASAPYVDLPNGLLSANGTNNGGSGGITLEGWVKVTGSHSWARIFDFGSTSTGEISGPGGSGDGLDYLMLSAENGTDVNTRRTELRNEDPGGGGIVTVDHPSSDFGRDNHFAVTWDEATGQILTYEDGALVSSVTTDDAMSDINDVNCWLGRSNWTGDQNLEGEFDEFRIYSRVLTLADIQLNQAGGADNNFGSLLALDLVLATNNLVTNTVANVRLSASLSIAGTQDVAHAGCAVFSSTDSNVVYITSDGILHAVNEGTATVTASLGGMTDSEEIQVTQDSTPPSLVSARANSSREVEIVFSEPVEEGTSQEVGNYVVHGANSTNEIFAVQRLTDESHVLITLTEPLPTCETITVLVSFVGDQSPLFNQIAESSPISFYNYVPEGLIHRYTFNNPATDTASGAMVLDGVGTADGMVVGAGGTFTGDRVIFPGGASDSTASVVLPGGLLSANAVLNGGSGQITFEGWVKVTGNPSWGRIFDFGSTINGEGRDYLMLSASVGTDVNNRRLELRNEDPGGGGIATIDHATTGFNREQHFAVTWDEATGQILVYEDGMQKSSLIVDDKMSDINDVNCYLGRSNWSGDSNMKGEFDEFRIYNRVLTAEDLAMNIALGPDFNLSTPPPCGGVVAAPHITIQHTGGTYTLSFTGSAGTSYRIQRAADLNGLPGNWMTISTQVAPAGGVVTYEDTAPPPNQAFYQVVTP